MDENFRKAVGIVVQDDHARVGRVVSPDQVEQAVQIVLALIPLINQFVALFQRKPTSA